MSSRHTARLNVHDSTLNQLFFGGTALTFGGEPLFFGPPPHPGPLTGSRSVEPVVIVADSDGKVLL